MKNQNRKPYHITLSIIAWVLCALTSAFGYSFLSGMDWSFVTRFYNYDGSNVSILADY